MVKRKYVYIGVLALAAAVYTMLRSRYFAFWGDEVFSLDLAEKSLVDFITGYFKHPDIHPFFYFLLLNIWQKIWHINYSNDWLYRLLSVIFYFSAVAFCAKKYLSDWADRWWFLALSIISSYFFIFAPMARYFSLVALVSVVAFYYFQKWLKKGERKDLTLMLLATVILLWTDYTASLLWLLSAGLIVIVWPGAKKRLLNSDLWIGLAATLVLAIPSVYLYLTYTKGSGTDWIFAANFLSLSNLLKFVLGALFIPYHILIGEYAQLFVSPILYAFLVIIGYVAFKNYQKLPVSEDKDNLRLHSLFCLSYTLIAAFLLVFLFGRYPLIVFARFTLTIGLLLLVLLVKLLRQQRWLLGGVLMINLLVIVCNLLGRDFVNTTYFQPINQTLAVARTYNLPILTGSMGQRDESTNSYLLDKYFPDRTVHDISAIKDKQFMVFLEYYMNWSDDGLMEKSLESDLNAKIISQGAYDNVNPLTRKFSNKIGLKLPAQKYHYYILQKINP